jgi:hypothetical protein
LAGYGRFAVAYPVLRDYLEDLPASTVVPSPGSLRFSVANGAAARQSVTLNTQSANPVIFKARADASWIKVSAISGQTSAGSPATLAISVDPAYLTRPGTFTGTVTITSGASDPQYLNVRADVTVARSNVVVTFAPNPVLEQPADADGSRWFFKIRLDEKAGAATRLTTLRINGTDYSGSLKSWFGSDLLNAMGSLEAALRASGPAGDQYFEFGGVDEASQQRWYQPVTLLFAAPQR